MCVFCNMCVSVCVSFVMFEHVCWFCNVWLFLRVGLKYVVVCLCEWVL